MRRPMILLTIGVAVLDLHTRLAHLETNTPRNAAVGTALGRRNAKMMVHHQERPDDSFQGVVDV